MAQMTEELQLASDELERDREALEKEKADFEKQKQSKGEVNFEMETENLKKMSEEVIKASEDLVIERNNFELERVQLEEQIQQFKQKQEHYLGLERELAEVKQQLADIRERKAEPAMAVGETSPQHEEEMQQLRSQLEKQTVAFLQETQRREETALKLKKLGKVVSLMKVQYDALKTQHQQQLQQIKILQKQLDSASVSSGDARSVIESAPVALPDGRKQQLSSYTYLQEGSKYTQLELEPKLEFSVEEKVTQVGGKAQAPKSEGEELMLALEIEVLTSELEILKHKNKQLSDRLQASGISEDDAGSCDGSEPPKKRILAISKQLEQLQSKYNALLKENEDLKQNAKVAGGNDDDEEDIEVEKRKAPRFAPTKPTIKPNVKMRPFVWERIVLPPKDQPAVPTIWEQMMEFGLDILRFEEAFGLQYQRSKFFFFFANIIKLLYQVLIDLLVILAKQLLKLH
jgi:hypothetical protein